MSAPSPIGAACSSVGVQSLDFLPPLPMTNDPRRPPPAAVAVGAAARTMRRKGNGHGEGGDEWGGRAKQKGTPGYFSHAKPRWIPRGRPHRLMGQAGARLDVSYLSQECGVKNAFWKYRDLNDTT
jgi:hypothetical protein